MRANGRGSRWRLLPGVCAALMLPAAARAQPTGNATAYDVPRECAERTQWQQKLKARLPALLQSQRLIDSLSVRVEAAGDGYVGSIQSSSAPELDGERQVRGASCAEVLDALGFIGALGLVRAAQGEQPKADAPPSDVLSTSDPGADANLPGASAHPTSSMRWGVTGFALLQAGITPGGTFAGGAALTFSGETASWQPLVAVGAYLSTPEELHFASGGALRLAHWSSHIVFCPWRLPLGAIVGLRACADFDAGRSTGEGVGVVAPSKAASPWWSTGAELRGEMRLGQSVVLSAAIEGVVPLWRAHFYLLPDVERYETPAFGLRAGSAVSVLF